jgi:hypothetical protein
MMDSYFFIPQLGSRFFSTFPQTPLRVTAVCRGTPVENRCSGDTQFDIRPGHRRF